MFQELCEPDGEKEWLWENNYGQSVLLRKVSSHCLIPA